MNNYFKLRLYCKLNRIAVLVQGFIFAGCLTYAASLPHPPLEALYLLCVITFIVSLWILATIHLVFKDLFNLYGMFYLSLALFSAGRIYLEVFGISPISLSDSIFTDETLTRTVLLVLMSMAGFHFGGLLGARPARIATHAFRLQSDDFFDALSTRHIAYIMLVVSSVPACILFTRDLYTVLSEGYFGLFARERVYGREAGLLGILNYLTIFFVPGLLFLFAGLKRNLKQAIIIYFIIIAYGSCQLFLGRRSWGSMYLISSIWLWHVLVRPVPLRAIALFGVLILFVVFPGMKAYRGETGDHRLSLEHFKNTYLSIENPAIQILSEMGGSMQTISHTLDLVPATRPYEYGSTYYYALTAVIPNIFWDIHPAVEHGSPNRWLTMTVAPATWDRGGGIGYSMIAEAYFNFGLIGSAFMMIIIGYIIARLHYWDAKFMLASKATIAVIMSSLLFWPRQDVNIFVRSVFITAILPYLAIVLLSKNRRYNLIVPVKSLALKHESPIHP